MRWIAAAMAAAILWFGLHPEPVPQWFSHQDKVHHVVGFAALAFSLRLAFPHVSWRWVAAACMLLAGAVELAQAMLGGRTASLGDFVAGAAGSVAGALGAARRKAGAVGSP